jgi:hypothetical protein
MPPSVGANTAPSQQSARAPKPSKCKRGLGYDETEPAATGDLESQGAGKEEEQEEEEDDDSSLTKDEGVLKSFNKRYKVSERTEEQVLGEYSTSTSYVIVSD